MVALKLAKAGYGGGDPEKVLNMPVGIVLAMIQFEKFQAQYERAFIDLNQKEG